MIYELRFYQITRGRMADMNARFNQNLIADLLPRNGVTCVGAWNSLAGPAGPRFVYLLAFRDFAHREEAWGSFYVDPEWARVRAQTNAGHEMVERHDLFFLKPNAAWQPDACAAQAVGTGEVHQLVMQQLGPGQQAGANEFLKGTWLPRLRASGARTLGVFDMVGGNNMQQLVMFHAWPDACAWQRGTLAAETAPDVTQALLAQRKKIGQAVFARAEVNLLVPVPGTLIQPALGLVP